jgi:rSAM/selenodomain-associated transferase 2
MSQRIIATPHLETAPAGEGVDPSVHVSVLIPAFNEALHISDIAQQAAMALAGHEVIVIDGGSADGTAEIAKAHATVLTSARSRGASLNDAARYARGNVLLFLHADTRLPPDAGADIARALRDPHVVGGAFRFAFDERCASAGVIAAWVNFRSWAFNVFLGDQALFVRKDIFLQAGGFRDWSLMEDLEILHRLRKYGPLRMTRSSIRTSARRHIRHGWLRTTGTVWIVTWLYYFGVPPRMLEALYRRPRNRSY